MNVNLKLETNLVEVTPNMARKWLVQNTRNRNLSRKKVKLYARDIKEGRWTTNHQGIGFYHNGILADGQHRLAAIVMANKPVLMLVTSGLPENTGADIDRHRPRSETDSIRIGGVADWIGVTEVAVVKAICNLHSDTSATYSVREIVEIAENVKPNVQFAIKSFRHRKKYLTVAPVMAAVAIAYDHVEDHRRLAEFCEVLLTGLSEGNDDSAAIRFRDYLMKGVERKGAQGSSKDRVIIGMAAMKAIQSFVARDHVKAFKAPKQLIYRLEDIDDMLQQPA